MADDIKSFVRKVTEINFNDANAARGSGSIVVVVVISSRCELTMIRRPLTHFNAPTKESVT